MNGKLLTIRIKTLAAHHVPRAKAVVIIIIIRTAGKKDPCFAGGGDVAIERCGKGREDGRVVVVVVVGREDLGEGYRRGGGGGGCVGREGFFG